MYRPISIFKYFCHSCFCAFSTTYWSILYSNNSLVRECFYLLVDICMVLEGNTGVLKRRQIKKKEIRLGQVNRIVVC